MRKLEDLLSTPVRKGLRPSPRPSPQHLRAIDETNDLVGDEEEEEEEDGKLSVDELLKHLPTYDKNPFCHKK